MTIRILLAWMVKIIAGSLLASFLIVLINEPSTIPIGEVIFRMMLIASMFFSPILPVLFLICTINLDKQPETALRKLKTGYWITFLILLCIGGMLVPVLYGSEFEPVKDEFNFLILMLSFYLAAILGWKLFLHALGKSDTMVNAERNHDLIDDL